MDIRTIDQVQPAVLTIQSMLQKIDRLNLPPTSRCDLESILVRQVTKELDRLLPWQAGHGEATSVIAIQIGQAMGLHGEVLHQLKLAALLHDIGLLMVPTPLRMTRQPLDADSYATIQNHPRLGSILLEPFSFLREATAMIAHHHEQWDGSGYPYGLRGEFIPLGARILAVADAFEAIQVPQAHDQALRDRIALRILQISSGTQFDPVAVDVLIALHGDQISDLLATYGADLTSGVPPTPASKWEAPPLPL